MKFVKALMVGLAALSIVAALLPATGAIAATTGWTCYHYSHAERAFAKKTNHARRSHGLPKVYLDPQLSKTATKHNWKMVNQKLLYHTTDAQFYSWVTHWTMLGENVGEGGGVRSLQKAFMQSPEHRANILDKKFKYLGVGVTRSDGLMWVTIQFEAANNPGTTLSSPNC